MAYIKQIITQHCKNEDRMNFTSRCGYTIKAMICEMISIFYELTPPDEMYYDELVYVAIIDSGISHSPGEPTVHWFYALSVGRGLFHNWFTVVWSDSD